MKRNVVNGVVGGIVGGILFGLLMQMMGMIETIAGMVGSESLVVGWLIHMMISVIFSVTFGLGHLVISNIWTLAVLFGIGIWIVGPLVIMPLMIGMGTNLANALAPEQLMSLATHLFFSFILAIVFKFRTEKKAAPKAAVR